MATGTETHATLDDLLRVEGKAELIGGKVVDLMPAGEIPSVVALEIVVSLRDYAKRRGVGVAYADGIGFALHPPLRNGRQTFSPDASYYAAPRPRTMRFVDGPPTFAAEVRSEGDYGPAAEAAMASKRADYFEAGTLAVWDVDPEAETIALYRAAAPTMPVVFGRGASAEAEPAVPGWRIDVDAIFGG